MTELEHGSNVAGLQTEAVLDLATDRVGHSHAKRWRDQMVSCRPLPTLLADRTRVVQSVVQSDAALS